MEDHGVSSKPAVSSPSQSTTPDIKAPSSRPLYSSKLGDQKGQSEGSSSNPATRQPPAAQQKTWNSTKNPIPGQLQTPQGGFNSQDRQSVTSALREGQKARITLAGGTEFEGIYASHPTDPSSCYLKMVQPKKGSTTGDIANGTGRGGSTMSFPRKDIMDARAVPNNQGKNDSKAMNGSRSFRTDAAISNSRSGSERVLKPWVPDSTDEADGSLERSANQGVWDQFAENERLFGIRTNYDENIYTTTIDKNHPQYHQRIAAAERKAREIERSAPTTAHVAEERVMDFVGGGDHKDEEEKYSGVRRQDFPPLTNRENKYTPPARRALTGQATAKGAPVDPAIISSQLKKQPTPKPEESKAAPAPAKAPTVEVKPAEAKPEAKSEGKQAGPKAGESKATGGQLPADGKSNSDKTATPLRPAAGAGRSTTTQGKDGPTGTAPSATSTVERDVLNSFKTFASQQRQNAEKVRSNKAKADKEVKLIELKKFADSFKLATPVPSDLISIIAKDPAKQKQIQAKAIQNAEDVAKQKAVESVVSKEKGVAPAKDANAKPPAEPAATAASVPGTADPRTTSSRPSAPQHSSSSGLPNRHQGNRQGYNGQAHYQQQNYRNNRAPPHLGGGQTQGPGNLVQRIRDQQQKIHQPQHPHMNHHMPAEAMRLPPTGPSNNADSSYGRRLGGMPPPHMTQGKLNPNSHEFRPNAFAPAFNPAGPSQGSSPRSSVHNVVEAQAVPAVAPTPTGGQLIRRKTKAIDVAKCFILSNIKSIRPPQGRNWDENDGLRPSYDTLPTWRQLQEETERADSTMHLTYKEYFEKLPLSAAATATPNPPHVVPQLAHQHQLPLHLQHNTHNQALRQSPHMPPMQMHTTQHGHVPHAPFSNPDDHRMMHSASAQSFASPRMGHVPMAYPPAMNSPAQVPYNQPGMQQYMNPGTPQMSQYRSFSNNPQFMPQQPPHMGGPMMMQPQFMAGPNGMVAAGPQVQMYPVSHPQFMPHGGGPPQSMAGSTGFPSPGRPAAPMMAHQGSHQGQPMYGMSPGMQYQQPVFTPQQPQQKFSGQRPQ